MDDHDVTELLKQLRDGEKDAEDRLIESVYSQLRSLAAIHLRNERPGHTLQPTALVHEVYLQLRRHRNHDWENRAHFLGAASRIMRRILVDHARRKCTGKRGSGRIRLPLEDVDIMLNESPASLVEVGEALDRLAAISPADCQIVEMRFISGLTIEEVAEVLGVSPKTVNRSWRRAKAWLIAELTHGESALAQNC